MRAYAEPFPKVPLGDLLALEYGAPLPERDRTGLGYPVFGSNGVVGSHSSFLVDGPGIVVGRKGSSGDVCWSAEPFWPIDTAYYAVPKGETDLRWLYWLLTGTDLKKLDAATGVPGLNRNDVYKLQVHRASPLEQRRIATVLDTLDEAIARAEAVVAKLLQVRAGFLHDLLTRGLNERGQLRNPIAHPEQFQESPVGRIPREWEVKRLGGWADFRAGHAFKHNELSESGWKVVRITNLHRNDFPYWHYDGPVIDSWIVEEGDLLFSWAGVAASIDAYLYKGERALLNQHIYKLEIPSLLERYFAFAHLQYRLPGIRRSIEGGAGQLHLSKEKIEGIVIPKPQPKELGRVVDLIKAQDGLLQQESSVKSKLNNLKAGLMSGLLSGRARVPETRD